MDDLKEIFISIWGFIKRLRALITPKRVLRVFLAVCILCAGCALYSVCRFDEPDFIKVFYGCTHLDEENFFYRINDKRYMILSGESPERFLGALGEVRIKEGNVTPYDNLIINEKKAALHVDQDSVLRGEIFYYIELEYFGGED